ncbi:MAG: type II secretion system F family protein [Clostridia bacterium]|nr:type II secretion system F family protein [Clostridia bacterium]
MPHYDRCYLKPHQHMIAYILGSIAAGAIVYLFYHMLLPAIILGLLAGIYLEKMYADGVVSKRKKNLRLQFRAFLESMSVATRAGSTEVHAIESAIKDLEASYKADSDILVELHNIMLNYKQGGVPLKVLFSDLAERSTLEDVHSFASIYSVIEGKNDRIGDILTETAEIIGEKIEIEQEIETTITSAKSETYMMLVLPILLVVAMSAMGGELVGALFEFPTGTLAATAALILFAISYVIAVKVSDINV